MNATLQADRPSLPPLPVLDIGPEQPAMMPRLTPVATAAPAPAPAPTVVAAPPAPVVVAANSPAAAAAPGAPALSKNAVAPAPATAAPRAIATTETKDAAQAPKIVFNPREELITTLIAPGQTLKGSLEGPEGVMVKGRVDGDIVIDDTGEPNTGTVVIEAGAQVNGLISGRRVIVFGTVNGPVISRTSLVIADTGVINGDVHYKRLLNTDGGVIEGRLQQIKDGADPLHDVRAKRA